MEIILSKGTAKNKKYKVVITSSENGRKRTI
jgi:hypothetical protein